MRLFTLLPDKLATLQHSTIDPGVHVKPLKLSDGTTASGILFAHFVNNQMVHMILTKDAEGNYVDVGECTLDQLEINYADGSAYIKADTSDPEDFYDAAAIWLPVSNTVKLYFSHVRQLEKTHRVIGLFDSRTQSMAFRSKIFTIAANSSLSVIAQRVGEKMQYLTGEQTQYLTRIAYDGFQLFTQSEIIETRDPTISVIDNSIPRTTANTTMADAFRNARRR